MSDTPQELPADLRRRAEDAARLEAENHRLATQLALRDTGFDPRNQTVSFAMQHYTGEPTAEAISEYLTNTVGVVTTPAAAPPPPEAPVPVPGADIATTRRDLASDAQPPGAVQRTRTSPYDAALQNYKEGIRRGEDEDTLRAAGVAAVLGAAAMGDKRVLVEPVRSGYNDPRTLD